MAFSRESIAYAWVGSGQRWDSMALQAVGAAIGGFLFWYWGVKLPPEILDNPALSGIAAMAIGALVGVGVVFVLRLLWWPFHKRLLAYGGLWPFLHRMLGARMWPILLMASGIGAFVVLFGIGSVLLAVQLARSSSMIGTTNQPEKPTIAASSMPPVSVPAISKAKNYFAPEKAKLGELVSSIAAHLNDEGLKAVRDTPRLGHSPLQNKAQLQETLDLAVSIGKLTREMSRSIWDDIIYRNPRFQEELSQIVGNNPGKSAIEQFQKSIDALHFNVSIFLERFDQLSDNNRGWIAGLLKRDMQATYDASSPLHGWINECNQRIDSMREVLR